MLVELINISKHFENISGGMSLTVLHNISLAVAKGESIAVVGPSGSGKSTLLNIIGALDKPSSGTVKIVGRDLSFLNDVELSKMRNKDIGFIFQLHHLLPQCTVMENVLIPTMPTSNAHKPEMLEKRAMELLKRVELTNHIHYFPGQLSGGEQQRVAVVRALINKPKLLLADEPTGSLDKKSSERLGELLVELNKEEGVALIVVTHSAEIANLMEKVYTLTNGKLEAM